MTRILSSRAVLAVVVLGVGCSTSSDPAPPDRPGEEGAPGSAVPGGRAPGSSSGGAATDPGGPLVETRPATSLGLAAFSANGRIQPHGAPTTYWFEYGSTASYGSRTEERPLGPRLAAHYQESWNGGLNGWAGGLEEENLFYEDDGGVSGGFARFVEPAGYDSNHEDGIGFVHLTEYLHVGSLYWDGLADPFLGGADPDLRDARVGISVRGGGWSGAGSELVFWAQSDRDLSTQNDETWQRANWAHTGFTLTEALAAGTWQRVEYQLANDTSRWTYAGTSLALERDKYVYIPLDTALGHLNCNFFHMLTFVGLEQPPSGAIDYDDFEITYRNHSVLFPSNGGKVLSAPAGGDDPARLTDGWRFGQNRAWRGPPNPQGPLEIVYELANPVVIRAVQIHQDPDYPSKDVEVLASSNGIDWTTIVQGTMPDVGPLGPNFANLLQRDLSAPATQVKIRILSGARADRWGLGEIEVFGSGATMATDDDWYNVNLDVTGLQPGSTIHYRLAAKTAKGTFYGADRTFTVPSTRTPEVVTGVASRIGSGTAKLEGRLNPLGQPAAYRFEYGVDTSYGRETAVVYGGLLETPRTVVASLADLVPGTTYHYRLVAVTDPSRSGTDAVVLAVGADATFVAK